MPIPDPFTPIALTAAITANIATDILKHHTQSLEGTLVGRALKWAGLIEPNFDERLRDTLSKALDLYFQMNPEYKLAGIVSFFRDPVTAEQICQYILNRQPIDQFALQQALEQHTRSNFEGRVASLLIDKRQLKTEAIIPDFLICYYQVLRAQVTVPQMAILLEVMDQSSAVIEEIKSSEERFKVIISQITDRISSQTKLLEIIASDQQAIKKQLGLDRPEKTIVKEIDTTIEAAHRSSIFESGGLCSGYSLQALPDRYFIAQEFSANREDLREALTNALNEYNVKPVLADDFVWPGHILCKISALIKSTPFGIYQLTTSQNRNVYLEFGIAIGLGRPFILVKDRDADVSPLAQGLEYYPMDSYLELRYEMGHQVRPFLTNIATYISQILPPPGTQRTAVIAHGDLDPIDFCIPLAKALIKYDLKPIILGDKTQKLARYMELEKIPYEIIGTEGHIQLNETLRAIQTARLGVYRIEKTASPDTFLALGMSMGLNRPGFLVQRSNSEAPSDIKGLSALKFTSYSNLTQLFSTTFNNLLNRYSKG